MKINLYIFICFYILYSCEISNVLNIKKDFTKIQVIVLKNDILPEIFIKNSFDFDFCKCVYNGKKFKLLESTNINQKVGKISDEYMNKCFIEKDSFSAYRIVKTAERIVKYIGRGFDITNADMFFNRVLFYAR